MAPARSTRRRGTRKGTVAQAVLRTLLSRVLTGKIAPGDKLPPERALAQELRVNRLTLRHALAQLGAKGLIEVKHGGGATVLDWRRTASLDILTELFAAAEKTQASVELLSGLLELERLTSAEVVALAAQRRTERELRAVETAIDALEALGERPKPPPLAEVVACEREVDRALVAASHNPAFTLVQNAVYRFVDAFPAILEAGALAIAVRVGFYRQVAELLRAKDSAGVRALAHTALELVHVQILEAYQQSLPASARPGLP